MKFESVYIYSLVAPFMILLSIIGLIISPDETKIFYLPVGIMGIFMITEKEVFRRLKRQNILNKIRHYKKNKY